MNPNNRRITRPSLDQCPCSTVTPNRRPPNNNKTCGRIAIAQKKSSSPSNKKTIATSLSQRIRSPSSTSSYVGFLYSKKFLFACSCFYLLSSSGGSTEVSSSSDENDGGKRRLLRAAVAAAAEVVTMTAESSADPNDVESPASSVAASSSFERSIPSSASALVTEPSNEIEDEEFDYEAYHARHHIPVPALGATMMGMGRLTTTVNADANGAADASSSSTTTTEDEGASVFVARRILSFAGTSEAMKMSADANGAADMSSPRNDEDGTFISRGILSFAGTNEAMKHLASEMDEDMTENPPAAWDEVEDEEEDDELLQPPPPINRNAMMYEATLAQITLSRSSLLWGSDSLDDEVVVAEEDPLDTAEEAGDDSQYQMNDMIDDLPLGIDSDYQLVDHIPADISDQPLEKSDQPLDNAESGNDYQYETDDSINYAPPDESATSPSAISRIDLDRGRHLVGIEVREVRPHQQIIIDYADEGDGSLEERQLRPLRIKYIMSDNVDVDPDRANNERIANLKDDIHTQLLSTLLETSFNRTAALWSRALSLQPVSGGIAPTVPTCGGAMIPSDHRAKGVDDADVVVYLSADNRYCGGALLHSAICDYDQRMRPLVANINVCTKNIPTSTEQSQGTQILKSVISEYDGYISTETARILGASTSLFRHYHNSDSGSPYGSSEKLAACVDGTQETILLPNIIGEEIDSNTGGVYYEIRTPKVIEVIRNHFDCMTLTGARLEAKSRGSLSCFGGFLDERFFFGEQVSSFQATAEHPTGPTISPLTLALLEDSSWYVANYTVSSEVPFGRGAGCQFVHGSGCISNEDGVAQVVSAHGKGFHCSDIGSMGCDASHSFKAKCDLRRPTSVAWVLAGSSPPQEARNDFCPMHVRGAIDCANEDMNHDSPILLSGEVYGKSSKCFLSDKGTPMCLRASCNENTQSIDVHHRDQVFSCQSDGQIIDTKKGLRIECPRIAAVCPSLICPSNCSGRGVCDEDRDGKHSCICDDPFDESPGCWGQ